jgi:hypothetical protein
MAGYKVWIDKNKLIGGEEFWDEIGTKIKDETIKFIVILSGNSIDKSGVKDEIAFAKTVEKEQNLSDFILPLLKEQVSLHITLNRKNYIDFTENWGARLLRVLEFLEKHNVPKFPDNTHVQTFNDVLKRKVIPLEQTNETLVSNQFAILSMPQFICFYTFDDIKNINDHFDIRTLPIKRLGNYLESFLQAEYKIFGKLEQSDAVKIVSSLILKTFYQYLKSKNIKDLSCSNATDWYIPKDLIKDDKQSFKNWNNISTYRKLVGKSKDYYWHFGFKCKFIFDNKPYFQIIPRLIYTEDGKIPIGDDLKQLRLRISRTKNWYNEKWRELLCAFMSWLSENTSIKIKFTPKDIPLEKDFEDGNKTGKSLTRLYFGKKKIVMSSEELAKLESIYKNYVKTFAVELGFVKYLLKGIN